MPHYDSAIPAELLIKAGKALYGEQWKNELAHTLGENERRVRFWAADERPIPAHVPKALLLLLSKRRMETEEVIRALRKASPSKVAVAAE